LIFTKGKKDGSHKKQATLFKDDLLEQAESGANRKYQRELMRQRRAEARDVPIDKSRQSMIRRNRCKNDPERFCQVYFKDIFYNPFTDDQRAIIEAIQQRIRFGGYRAIAAERGGGKSSITKIIAGIWAVVYGYLDWIMLINANAAAAEDTLKDIKDFYTFNDLLRDDFPEVCDPIRALDGASQRASFQTSGGQRTRLKWGASEIVMPRVKGSGCSGAIITAIGIDGAIRGKVKGAKRPRLVIMDDIETGETAASYTQTSRRRDTIGKDITGLAGPGRQMAIVMLCTVINRKCLAWEFTDSKQQPAWNGIRQRWIKHWPKNPELWDQYIDKRKAGQQAGDPFAREAVAFYLSNRPAMDEGVSVSNVHRFDKKTLPDGSALEISSIQAAYNIISDKGLDYFSCEYQNEPPEDQNLGGSGITELAIKNKAIGLEKGLVPRWAEYLTAGIDIGGRAMHWVVVAWRAGMIGHIVDYGVNEVHSPLTGRLTAEENKQALEAAINTALLEFRDAEQQAGYPVEMSDKSKPLDLVLVDSGWQEDPVFDFCRITNKKYRPCKGFGTSHKLAYRSPKGQGKDRIVGFNWCGYWQDKARLLLYHVNSDFWKLAVQNAFLIDPGKPGSLTLWGQSSSHTHFSQHLTAESWQREFTVGKGVKEYFKVERTQNHWLDAAHYAAAAAAVLGLKVVNDAANQPRRISLARLQEERKAKQG
jgi:hypothetical protein